MSIFLTISRQPSDIKIDMLEAIDSVANYPKTYR